MNNIAIGDAMFLLGEAAGRPAQVITLQLYRPPAEVDLTEWMGDYFQQLLAHDNLKPAFRRRPTRAALSPSTLRWIDDEAVELDHHVRRSALPGQGRVRELLEAVSVQHGVTLDRRRPLWEFHVFEGLEGGRYATAFKTHHAIADGMSLAKHVIGSLSPDPDARGMVPPWAMAGEPRPRRPRTRTAPSLAPVLRSASVVRSLVEMSRDDASRIPFEAPPSPLNVKVGGARRFAGDQWPLERLKALATAVGGTVNDVGLAMAGGALRSYLDELGGLPERPLIAMVPVSVRREGVDFEGAGNAFGAMLCDLGTDRDDSSARLASICAQTRAAKNRFAQMSPAEVLAVSKVIMGGAIISSLTGITALPRQPFNLIISNVPAPNSPLYCNGAEMTDIYPVSMISEAQAMNITLTRYNNLMTFGIVGDRKALPHLQRMLIHLDGALADLEKAVAG
ncbi:MAG: wax ester/triacylglycerol synthase family O-acyltransferase [Propionibacteriales bacterium]|nr:wax ester/triacylglycerol synthase family O-acyltransferase [Propionibacteriales bacterium]